MTKYCRYCGTLETEYWTGRYDVNNGEKEMSSKCTNPRCAEGRWNMCPGHTRGFWSSHCKHCGRPMHVR